MTTAIARWLALCGSVVKQTTGLLVELMRIVADYLPMEHSLVRPVNNFRSGSPCKCSDLMVPTTMFSECECWTVSYQHAPSLYTMKEIGHAKAFRVHLNGARRWWIGLIWTPTSTVESALALQSPQRTPMFAIDSLKLIPDANVLVVSPDGATEMRGTFSPFVIRRHTFLQPPLSITISYEDQKLLIASDNHESYVVTSPHSPADGRPFVQLAPCGKPFNPISVQIETVSFSKRQFKKSLKNGHKTVIWIGGFAPPRALETCRVYSDMNESEE
jgi:hypothetical protein